GITSRALTITFIFCTIICFSPVQIPIRLPVSIFTGIMLMCGSEVQVGLLSNKYIVKFGNASYVLYLVHWPVITLWKYYTDKKTLDHLSVVICLVNSLIIAFALHELVELKMMRLSKKSIIIMVIVLYALILIVTSIPLQS
ncbi:hypothetical protein PFISCL1PPCAC_386, partial [Pristionchus fissidentatus]